MTEDRRRALRRVRFIAAASSALEILKLLPLLDAAVLLVEWLGLKTALPIALEISDAWREKRLGLKALLAAPLRGNWPALIARAFGGLSGGALLLTDVSTDVAAAVLPAPLDGMDVPPLLADAIIAMLAHRELQALAKGLRQPEDSKRSRV